MYLDTTVPRILGALFYYPPHSDIVVRLSPFLSQLPELYPWSDLAELTTYTQQLANLDLQLLEYDFSILFEGQGVMPAPPWGSAYLDKDNLLMGESTLRYRAFLAENGFCCQLSSHQPEDQFGLMLLSWVQLVESQQFVAAQELMNQHLLPWAYRYLEQVAQAQVEYPFYRLLAQITTLYLRTLQTELRLVPDKLELHR